jgi:signal recognition particle GTPase
MKITIDIGGNDYTFEMNRMVYKRLLADEEYAKMQNEISKRIKIDKIKKDSKGKSKKQLEQELEEEFEKELINDDINVAMLRNLVMEEQTFYYALMTNHPEITFEKASALIDLAYEEYGREAVSELTATLMRNFTPVGEEPKKKMNMRMS